MVEIQPEHLKRVRQIASVMARKMQGHADLDDLIGDGMVGLVKAAKDYSAESGAPFSAYLKIRVIGEIQDGLRRMDMRSRADYSSHADLLNVGLHDTGDSQGRTWADVLIMPSVDPLRTFEIGDMLKRFSATDVGIIAGLELGLTREEMAAISGKTVGSVGAARYQVIQKLRKIVVD